MVVHKVIKANNKKLTLNLKELVTYKDLLYYMVYRDITVIYKQTILGYAWSIVNPLFTTLLFTVIFRKIANVDTHGAPAMLFFLSGVVTWNYFNTVVTTTSTNIVSSASVFTKVYFPRLIIPLTTVFSKLLDYLIAFAILITLVIIYRPSIDSEIYCLPFFFINMLFWTAGLSFLFSALTIQFRDVRFVMSFLMPTLMYATPVIFSAEIIQHKFGAGLYYLYAFLPMTSAIDGFRNCFIHQLHINWIFSSIGMLSSIAAFFTGAFYFRKTEKLFADLA